MDAATRDRIEAAIRADRVVLFMKGSKHLPMCGFSAKVVSILRAHGVSFATVNVLADEAIRSGVKEYASWPTIPQLYIDGKFVGGCDIVTELETRGELGALLAGGESTGARA